MTAANNIIRPITYSFELLDWILEQAMRRGPHAAVASTVIDILNELITEIHARGFLPARGEPGVDMYEILDVFSKPSNVATMSAELLEFVHDTLISITFLDKELELHQVIEQLARVARLQSAITFTKIRHEVRIKSSRDLIDTHGVLIDVVVLHQLRVRSALRPWHPRYGWEEVPQS
ncbi:MAG: hypothetical protein EOR00_24290 [Mesorhizobium sp.]|uniref:hypothetical protein n=1 Tax=Mesorhizobium sp. TaxID=1871066 RepID=UPI000FE79C27|nr:hypothetical protein [Mesorhizobium sp.]RWP13962.1 MAG: hypothetical protein EOR00_24290 [Mesorhizobium sp.]